MAQLENSSKGVIRLRNSLNQSIETLKKTKQHADKLVEEIHKTWADHQYVAFKKDFDDGTKTVNQLFEKMAEFDKNLLTLQNHLKHYEELKLKSAFRS